MDNTNNASNVANIILSLTSIMKVMQSQSTDVEIATPVTIQAQSVQPFVSDYCVYENDPEFQQITVLHTETRGMVESEMARCKKYYMPIIMIIMVVASLAILIVIGVYVDIYG
jgi:hypothetical protein